ncbi:unnamed protein product [Brugia pahangi]|uniref:Uncharacterized protein n=1 Tax=Brugia pahangi TaxID=6280 RepID=A0A0N4TKQ8_BRUPA|nr:unnamed protein product [Brugia pahangi]
MGIKNLKKDFGANSKSEPSYPTNDCSIASSFSQQSVLILEDPRFNIYQSVGKKETTTTTLSQIDFGINGSAVEFISRCFSNDISLSDRFIKLSVLLR